MSCSGHKCSCAKFQGGHQVKTCRGCSHGRNWHYDSDSLDGGDDNDNSDEEDSKDDDEEDYGGGGTNGRPNQPSTGMKNKRIVSSLAADLVQGGEYSEVDVGAAKREANAGLTRRQVGPTFSEPWP